MPELRWILIAFGAALLVGIYVWGRRGAKESADTTETRARLRPEPALDAEDMYAPDMYAPLPISADHSRADEQLDADAEPATAEVVAPSTPSSLTFATAKDVHEPTIEANVTGADREPHHVRVEPTFTEESVTAELPAREFDEAMQSNPAAVAAPVDAPTLSMSSTPQPRRIERRKIIALRLACPQRISGVQLQAALDSEALQHGRYDVFHRLDEHGAAVFSIASMVEPGTFNLEKMPQETYPGITLFAQLPGPLAGMLAFNELIGCSKRLHATLGGTLQDERGVPLTVHRIERIRQEIREFEHRTAAEPALRSTPAHSPAP